MTKQVKADVEDLTARALKNIDEDRGRAEALLIDLMIHMKQQNRVEQSGLIAAKYLETLQRSNEQLVKIIHGMKKISEVDDAPMTEEERDALYDEIQRQKHDGNS